MNKQELQQKEIEIILDGLSLSNIKKPRKRTSQFQSLTNNIKKVKKINRSFYFNDMKISYTEIEIIEPEDFDEKQKLVKEIRQFIQKIPLKFVENAPWSILELCSILISLYDHEMRNGIMREHSIVSLQFYDEMKKITGLKRSAQGYFKKIKEVREWKLTLDDLKQIRDFIINEGDKDDRLNDFLMIKKNNKMIFENREQGSLIKWNKFKEVIISTINEEKKETIKNVTIKDEANMIFEQDIQYDKHQKNEELNILAQKTLQYDNIYEQLSQYLSISPLEIKKFQERKSFNQIELIEHFINLLNSEEEEVDYIG